MVIGCSATLVNSDNSPPPLYSVTGTLNNDNLTESSGLVTSYLNDNTLWSHNDSKNSASLVAISPQGNLRAIVDILGVDNVDWEDLSNFRADDKSYLVIADIGDNYSQRESYQLHIVAEPDLNQIILNRKNSVKRLSVSPEWSINFTYPDEAKDSEAIAVDIRNEKIILLSKREAQPRLFELPLYTDSPVIAREIGAIPRFPEPENLELSFINLLGFSSMPTAMDISPDGNSIAVLTYSNVYVFDRASSSRSGWLDLLSSTPRLFPIPLMEQAEAIAFDLSGQYLYITSENQPSPIIKIDLRDKSDK